MRQKTEQSSELVGHGESAETGSDVEISAVKLDNENPAGKNCLMEEILTRANLRQALQRVKSNKWAPQVLPLEADLEKYFFYSALQPVSSGLTEKISDYDDYNSFSDAASQTPSPWTLTTGWVSKDSFN